MGSERRVANLAFKQGDAGQEEAAGEEAQGRGQVPQQRADAVQDHPFLRADRVRLQLQLQHPLPARLFLRDECL